MLIEGVPHGDIVQADREMAASIWFSHLSDIRSEPQAVHILAGQDDDHVAVQGVARHRIDSMRAGTGSDPDVMSADRRMAAFVWFAGNADMDSGPRVREMLTGQDDGHRAVRAMVRYRLTSAIESPTKDGNLTKSTITTA